MLLAMAATPIVIMLTRRFNLVDAPGARKVHAAPVARLGGVAIFFAVIAMIVPVLLLRNTIGDSFRINAAKIVGLLAGGSVVFIVGLVDDLKGVRARCKLIAQIAAALVVCAAGARIRSLAVEDLFTVEFGLWSWPLTVFWIVGLTNAVNIIDGLDGLAAGISAIACGVIAILAVHSGQTMMAVIMLALLGALVGFLFFNFNPAKIFMGDCGSMFLGFTLASASVLCTTKSHALVGLALPVLALGIPIFDTLFSMLRRFLERRSMFSPDRAHFHHRLLDLGLSQHQVAIVAYSVTATVAGLGLFMIYTRSVATVAVFVCLLVIVLLVFRLVGSVRLRETVSGLRAKYDLQCQVKAELRDFEEVQLHFRNARTFDDWWQAACLAGEKLGAEKLSLDITTRANETKTLFWHRKNGHPESRHSGTNPGSLKLKANSQSLRAAVPVKDRRNGTSLRLIVDIPSNGSVESAGRKVALLARLAEEYNVNELPTDMCNR